LAQVAASDRGDDSQSVSTVTADEDVASIQGRRSS